LTAGGGQGAARAMEDLPEIRVNAKLREYLSVDVPPREKVVSYLTNIGEVYAPDWTPSVTAKTLALACVYCAHLRCVRGGVFW